MINMDLIARTSSQKSELEQAHEIKTQLFDSCNWLKERHFQSTTFEESTTTYDEYQDAVGQWSRINQKIATYDSEA